MRTLIILLLLCCSISASALTGHVILKDYDGPPVPVIVELLQLGTVTRSETVFPDSNGSFSVNADSPTIRVKAGHWLSETTSNPELITLTNGDCDGDDEITSTDLSILGGALGSLAEDASWVTAADLDGDGEVTSTDLSILGLSLGKIGSPSSEQTSHSYYIAPLGDDLRGLGSINSPWKSLSKANSAISEYDIVHVYAGDYAGSGISKGRWAADGKVFLSNSSVSSSSCVVEMTGFTFTGGTYGLFISASSAQRKFTDCSFTQADYYFVGMQDNDGQVTFTDSMFTGSVQGLAFYHSGSLVLKNCSFDATAPGLANATTTKTTNLIGCSFKGTYSGSMWNNYGAGSLNVIDSEVDATCNGVYLNTTTGTLNIRGGSVTGSVTGKVIRNTGLGALTVDGLSISLSKVSPFGIIHNDSSSGSSGPTSIRNCTIACNVSTASHPIYIANKATAVDLSNNSISLASTSAVTAVCIFNQLSPSVYGNTIEDTGTLAYAVATDSTGTEMGNVRISGNTFRSHTIAGYVVKCGYDGNDDGGTDRMSALIENNTFYCHRLLGSGVEGGCHTIIVGHQRPSIIRNNVIIGGSYAAVLKHNGADWHGTGGFYNNLVVDCTFNGAYIKGLSGACIEDNTFIHTAWYRMAYAYAHVGPNITPGGTYNCIGSSIKGNTFEVAPWITSIMIDSNQSAELVCDYNLFSNVQNNLAGVVFTSLESWIRASGADIHSVVE